jgi:hypothetical protein
MSPYVEGSSTLDAPIQKSATDVAPHDSLAPYISDSTDTAVSETKAMDGEYKQ